MNKEEYYKYWLSTLYKIPGNKIKKLLKIFNDPQTLYALSNTDIKKQNILTGKELDHLEKTKEESSLNKKFESFLKSNIKLCTFRDETYPVKLKNLEDSPYSLFYRGNLPDNELPSVAVIGSRSCSNYGAFCAETIVKELVLNKVGIISGMAYGIDSLAQKTAIKFGGYTLAVLGTGVNICYPKTEFKLYKDLQDKGGVISEYPPDTEGEPWHFPMRNRIISGMADAVLVIEARERSGTLITVDRALEQGRDVFAVPGRINDKLSYSCNWLIKQGAYIATSAKDILEVLSLKYNFHSKNNSSSKDSFRKKEIIGLEREENLVYSIICFDDVCIDDIIHQVDLSLFKVNSICTKLVLKGLIREVGKGRFIRNA